MTSTSSLTPISTGDTARRIAALRSAAVLDTPPEQSYDAVARIAAAACHMPIAIVSLVDGERLWFKAAVGVGVTAIPSESSFCCEAANSKSLLFVHDALADVRFRSNGLVSGALGIRCYAGAPIVVADIAVGTVCVLDRFPRQLAASQQATLLDLAEIAAALLKARIEAFTLLSSLQAP